MTKALTIFGVVMALGGIAHWAGVAVRARGEGLENEIPYLVLVGLAQLTAGALAIIAARARAAGEQAARPIAVLAAAVATVYAAAVVPALTDAPVLFLVAPVVYSAGTTAFAVAISRAPSRASG